LGASTQFAAQNPTLSPDDHFVAYETVESGRREIVVRSFPDGKTHPDGGFVALRMWVGQSQGGYEIWLNWAGGLQSRR
jgi:hypothetical protein